MLDGRPRSPEKLPSTLDVPRLDTTTSFAKEAYAALKRAIIIDKLCRRCLALQQNCNGETFYD